MKLADIYLQVLAEAQQFNFAPVKAKLEKLISDLVVDTSNSTLQKEIKSIIYDIVVNDVDIAKIGKAKQVGFDDTAVNAWKTYFSGKFFNTGGGGPWAQVDINANIPRKTGQDRTLNYYITVERTKENIAKFLKSFNTLISKIRDFSNDKQTPISFKTHRHLDYFMSHNDSLKFYYYDPSVEKDLVAVVKKWLADSGIKTGQRTHEFGVDKTVSGQGAKSSFGQLIADHVGTQFIATITKNANKYSSQQYVQWLETHLPTLIKQISVQK